MKKREKIINDVLFRDKNPKTSKDELRSFLCDLEIVELDFETFITLVGRAVSFYQREDERKELKTEFDKDQRELTELLEKIDNMEFRLSGIERLNSYHFQIHKGRDFSRYGTEENTQLNKCIYALKSLREEVSRFYDTRKKEAGYIWWKGRMYDQNKMYSLAILHNLFKFVNNKKAIPLLDDRLENRPTKNIKKPLKLSRHRFMLYILAPFGATEREQQMRRRVEDLLRDHKYLVDKVYLEEF